jgi:hypothetical protein
MGHDVQVLLKTYAKWFDDGTSELEAKRLARKFAPMTPHRNERSAPNR